MPILKLFQKLKRRQHFQSLFLRFSLLDIKDRLCYNNNKIKIQANIPDEYRCQNSLKKILGNQIQHHIKRILCHDQAGFISEMKDDSINENQSMRYTTLIK